MYYNPYVKMLNNNNGAQQMSSYIRVLHSSPNAPSVDIYADGNLLVEDLAFTELSEYLPVPPGNYTITVFPSGEMKNPVIDTDISIPPDVILNVAAIGTLPDISLYPIPEPNIVLESGEACVRFIHLSPNAPNVDINLSDGTEVFDNVGYTEITDYVCVPAGSYSFDVAPSGTDNVVLSVPNVELSADNFYSIYAVGLVGESPALEALLVPEPRY